MREFHPLAAVERLQKGTGLLEHKNQECYTQLIMRPPAAPPVSPIPDEPDFGASSEDSSSSTPPQKRTLPRRKFLIGAAATGLFMAGGGLAWKLGAKGQAPAAGLLTLSEGERSTVEAIVEVFFPGGGGLPAGSEVGVVEAFDAYVDDLPGNMGTLMKLLVQGIEWGAIFTSSRFERFSKLPLEQREQVISAWENSKIYASRSGFMSLKLALGMGYYESPQVRKAIGWYMPCLDWEEERDGEEWL